MGAMLRIRLFIVDRGPMRLFIVVLNFQVSNETPDDAAPSGTSSMQLMTACGAVTVRIMQPRITLPGLLTLHRALTCPGLSPLKLQAHGAVLP
jgi:hypothetical protein